MKTLHLHYVAMIRERAGMSNETIGTNASTIAELYAEIADRHHFPWATRSIRAAVNDALCDWSAPLHDGDRVLFLPPSSGG
jgi:molybdopterin converting factor small subunit